jgi:hypothetical protein
MPNHCDQQVHIHGRQSIMLWQVTEAICQTHSSAS